MSKKKLRKEIIFFRKNNYKNININLSLLKEILKNHNCLEKKNIGAYYPINNEFNCCEALKKLKYLGNKISLPVIKKKKQMDFYEWSFHEPLTVGQMGVPEPYERKKVSPDVLLVPLVAFDEYKFRLGYGGGFYDRYINKISKFKKILTIGIAFSFQQVSKLPSNNYDKKLDYILTEKKFIV